MVADSYIKKFEQIQGVIEDVDEQELALIDIVGRENPEASTHDICGIVAVIRDYFEKLKQLPSREMHA